MQEPTRTDVSSQLVFGKRAKGPYTEIPNIIMEVVLKLQEQGKHPTGAPIYIYHEHGQEGAGLTEGDLEVVWPVSETIEGVDGMSTYELPGGSMVTTTHVGPYDQCIPVYENLFKWIGENGLTITGPIREVYTNNPQEVGLENAITEIYVPVN